MRVMALLAMRVYLPDDTGYHPCCEQQLLWGKRVNLMRDNFVWFAVSEKRSVVWSTFRGVQFLFFFSISFQAAVHIRISSFFFFFFSLSWVI